MTETSKFWNGTSTGDATDAPYDAATKFAAVLEGVSGSLGLTARGGVLRDYLNELACTAGSGQVTIGTGAALIYGTMYVNDSILTISGVTTPVGGTRVDRIVARKDWDAQTVRIIRIVGTPGAGAPALGAGTPAYTQTPGDVWDTELFQISTVITTGTITVSTDSRSYVPVHGDQSGESGTKHAYSNISGAPAFSGSVVTLVPGDVAVVGAAGTISDGAHKHAIAADPYVVGGTNQLAGTGGLNDPEMLVSLPGAGTYHYTFMGAFQLNTATAFSITLPGSFVAVGPGTVAPNEAVTLFSVGGPFGSVDVGSANMGVIVEGYYTVGGPSTLQLTFAGIGGNVYRVGGAMLHARRLY